MDPKTLAPLEQEQWGIRLNNLSNTFKDINQSKYHPPCSKGVYDCENCKRDDKAHCKRDVYFCRDDLTCPNYSPTTIIVAMAVVRRALFGVAKQTQWLRREGSKMETFCYPMEFRGIVFVRYIDHVAFGKGLTICHPTPSKGNYWVDVYENNQYITIVNDRESGPPTLKGGDPKASGLVLLKSDILELKKLG